MINVKIENDINRLKPSIMVVGVGGAGGNAVNNMIASGLEGCEFLVCNTDAQALEGNAAAHKIQLGASITRGLGAGANPEMGCAAAEESLEEIMGYFEGVNMVFVTAGMGGGTGTGAAAVIAQAARNAGILTVGVITKPFHFEGSHRMNLADSGIIELQKHVDTLIVIPNQNLFRIANEKTTFADAFQMADEVLQSGVRGVTDLMVLPGLVNLDFADIRAVMAEMGKAVMGTGEAEGERRAVEAAEAAISNPLLDDVSMKGARGVLINITGGLDMTLFEVDEAANRIRDEVDSDANIIFGSTFDQTLQGKMRVSVVATGIDVEVTAPRPLHLSGMNAEAARRGTGSAPQQAAQQPVTVATAKPAVGTMAAGNGGYAGYGGARPVRSMHAPAPSLSDRGNVGVGIPASIIPQSTPVHQPMASAEVTAPVTTRSPVTTTSSVLTASAPIAERSLEQPVVGTATTATPYTAAATATARKMEESDVDQGWTQPAAAPVTQNYKRSVPPAGQPSATRIGDNFIPPRAIDPRAATAARAEVAEMEMAAPKKEEQAAKPVKKSPSLFERFTMQREKETVVAAPVRVDDNMSVVDGGKAGEDEDELDIPAFLRRQSS